MRLCSTYFDPSNGEMATLTSSVKKAAFLASPNTGWEIPVTFRYALVHAALFITRDAKSGTYHPKTFFSMCMLKSLSHPERNHRFAAVYLGFTLCHERLLHAVLFDFACMDVIKGFIPFDKRLSLDKKRAQPSSDFSIDLSDYYCDVTEPLCNPAAGRTMSPSDILMKGLQYLKIYGFLFRKDRLIHIDSENAYATNPDPATTDFARTDEEVRYINTLSEAEREEEETKIVERAKLYQLLIRSPVTQATSQDHISISDGKTRLQKKRIAGVLIGEQPSNSLGRQSRQEKRGAPVRQNNSRKTTKPKRAIKRYSQQRQNEPIKRSIEAQRSSIQNLASEGARALSTSQQLVSVVREIRPTKACTTEFDELRIELREYNQHIKQQSNKALEHIYAANNETRANEHEINKMLIERGAFPSAGNLRVSNNNA